MIYTDVPNNLKLDINTFQEELDFFNKNIPYPERRRLAQFRLLNLKMYFFYVYSPNNLSKLFNLDIKTSEESYNEGMSARASVVNSVIDSGVYNYSNLNFFSKTIQSAKTIKQINNISLLYIKPFSVIKEHTHPEHEFIIHTLLNDMELGHLEVYSEQDVIKLNKRGQQFRHEAYLPHGGSTMQSEAWVLSVAANL